MVPFAPPEHAYRARSLHRVCSCSTSSFTPANGRVSRSRATNSTAIGLPYTSPRSRSGGPRSCGRPRRTSGSGRRSPPRATSPPSTVARTAYTPLPGSTVGTSPRFAVGKPIVRPRFAPVTTVPAMRYGRPSSSAAARRRPRTQRRPHAAARHRLAAECQRRHFLERQPGRGAAASRSVSLSPARPRPKRKSYPSTTAFAPSCRDEHVLEERLRAEREQRRARPQDDDVIGAGGVRATRPGRRAWSAAAAARIRDAAPGAAAGRT